jgi:hypothetical protein
MSPEAQKGRMNIIFSGAAINGPALAELIDECKTAAGLFMEKHNGILGISDTLTIHDILAQTDGKETVANIAGEEDIVWLLELRDMVFGSGLQVEDLKDL